MTGSGIASKVLNSKISSIEDTIECRPLLRVWVEVSRRTDSLQNLKKKTNSKQNDYSKNSPTLRPTVAYWFTRADGRWTRLLVQRFGETKVASALKDWRRRGLVGAYERSCITIPPVCLRSPARPSTAVQACVHGFGDRFLLQSSSSSSGG